MSDIKGQEVEAEKLDEMKEEDFAKYVEEAKKELKKQVISMFIFSTLLTAAVYGIFYSLI